ncbi:MAG: hypothetical protein ACC645_21810 [Pirellulales bacterium]
MRVAPRPSEIRDLVKKTFHTFGLAPDALGTIRETLLLSDGTHRARSYRAEGLMAMWLLEVGILQFYDAHGNMLRTVNLFEEREPQRMAA